MFIKKILPLLLFILAASFLLNEALIYSQNNLLLNKHWITYKSKFYYSYAGGIESSLSRNLLASNKLVGNGSFGHQLLFSRERFDLQEINFEIKFFNKTHLDIIYNVDGDHVKAVRISRNRPNNFFFEATLNGKFLKQEWYLQTPIDTNLHRYTLKQIGNELQLLVDNLPVSSFEGSFIKSSIGMYTGAPSVEVHNVTVIDKSGLKKNLVFYNETSKLPFFFKNLAIVATIVLLIGSLVALVLKKSTLEQMLKTSLFIFLLSLLYFVFDFSFYSKIPKNFKYVNHHYIFTDSKWPDLEKHRFNFFQSWFTLLGGQKINLLKSINFKQNAGYRICNISKCSFFPIVDSMPAKQPNAERFVYLGASFSENAGVLTPEESFFDRLSVDLIKNLNKKKIKADLINLSIAGLSFSEDYEDFRAKIEILNPTYVIFGVYLRPEDYNLARAYFHKLKLEGKKVIYLFPVNDPEFKIAKFMNMRAILEARKKSNEIHDIYEFIVDVDQVDPIFYYDANLDTRSPSFRNSDWIWWDSGHMTPYGQQKLGELMATKISEFVDIENKKRDPKVPLK